MFFLYKDSSQLKPIINLIYLLLLMQTLLKMFFQWYNFLSKHKTLVYELQKVKLH